MEQDKTTLAEQILQAYLKPIYRFSLKRTASLEDAEDLTQEICLKLCRPLPVRQDIRSMDSFVWTVAHHTLVNYYRGKSRSMLSADGLDEDFEGHISYAGGMMPFSLPEESLLEKEQKSRLKREIAYLSRTQRQVVILYYYDGKKQQEIADSLKLPLGTVKWHLNEARHELKKGLETMREMGNLAFNPITFARMGLSGSMGELGNAAHFFRSALSQNIAYCTWKKARTLSEIADCLGVSPVYVESEVAFLEEYGFLFKEGEGKKSTYRANLLIDEPTSRINALQDSMYEQAAALFANALYDRLLDSGLLSSESLCYPRGDVNFALWALLPYIASVSGEKEVAGISFEEAATIRADGGQNIAYATIARPGVTQPVYADSFGQWNGPCWNASDKLCIWQVDSEWSGKRVNDSYFIYIQRDISLLQRLFAHEDLNCEEYAYLVQRGYLKPKTDGEADSLFKDSLRVVWIRDAATRDKLVAIGGAVKAVYQEDLQKLKDPYAKAVLDATPPHLHTVQKYVLQYIFSSDGWFLLHCLKELLGNGRLKLPTEEQRRDLSVLLISL